MNSKYDKILYCVYFGIFLILWLLLFWKCKFGFPLDESFYVLFCYRFINGDIPVLHEWNPTQISAVWLHPIVWLFYRINNSSEQIIITFRYVFTVIWGLSALFLFFRLRKLSLVGSAAASLLFLITVPYGQQALYYNTLGLITFTSTMAIITTANKYKYLQYFVSGFLFAVSVTCCPFLLLLYLIYLVVAVVSLFKRNGEHFKIFCYATLGTMPAVIIFCLYYIVPSSLKGFIEGLPHLLADREHQFTYMEKFSGFYRNIADSSPAAIFVFLTVLSVILIAILKKSEKVNIIGFAVICISIIVLDVTYLMKIEQSQAGIMFAPMFIGLYCGLLSKDQTAKKVFCFMWIPGLIYMFCINISSNVGFEAEAIPAVICTIASCFLIEKFLKENMQKEKKELLNQLGVFVALSVLFLTICSEVYVRSTFSFGNGRLSGLTVKIENGPFKDIYCSQNIYDRYTSIARDLKSIKNNNSKKILLLTNYWFYLDIDSKPLTSSCNYPFVDDIFLAQLEEYYSLYPQFIPDLIYLGDNHIDLLERVESYGYSGDMTELGAYILYRH